MRVEDEKRAALERALAAELAALGEDEEDGDDDETEENISEVGVYQRLDLEAVLKRAAANETDDQDDGNCTWTRLRQSVAFCETHVFGELRDELEVLKTQLLPLSAAVERVVVCRGPAVMGEVPASSGSHLNLQEAEDADETNANNRGELSGSPELILVDERIPPGLTSAAPQEVPTASIKSEPAAAKVDALSRLETSPPSTISTAVVSDPPQQEALVEHPPQPGVEGESRRVRVQLNAQRTHYELTAWLQAKQLEIEREHLARACLQRQLTVERDARVAMASEERVTRILVEHQRMAGEGQSMQREDEQSQWVERRLAEASHREQHERQHMAQEEVRVWRRLHRERETQQREKLVEEQSRLRREHHRVMDELVATLALQAESRRKKDELERRREYQEASWMRSEEHWARRVLVYERMVREDQERRDMGKEDSVGRLLRDEERDWRDRQRQERERIRMEDEDARSRVWETLWRLRIKHLRKWTSKEDERSVRRRWCAWQALVGKMKRQEEARCHIQAACVIQSQVRKWIQTIRLINHETAQAARVVQSAFRGFHVRCKFQNALDMAHRMTRHREEEDDEFGEVNLDEWIGKPPELDDDWEKPTMPQAIVRGLEEEEPVIHSESEEDDKDEEDEDEEVLREETMGHVPQRIQSMSQQQLDRPVQISPSLEAGGQNLAAVLWNKMRKRTQKQKLVADERQRQQDPVYRVQKLLNKTTRHQTHSTNQSTSTTTPAATTTSIAWGTIMDKKKPPKVKLPSLVERLRKKTAAAR